MYGDGAHKKLLDSGWAWDMHEYHRHFEDGINMVVTPTVANPPSNMREERASRYLLCIAIDGGERQTVAGYPNLNTAAMAVCGVE